MLILQSEFDNVVAICKYLTPNLTLSK